MKRWIVLFFISIGTFFIAGCTNQGVSITISFNSNGGSFVPAITTDGSSIINLPDDPTKEGYSFGGWYWDNETFNELFTASSLLDRPISNNLTVYAKWNEEEIPIGSIKVTFDSQGGSEVSPQYVQKGGTLSIPVISKEGHTLDGWYTSVNQGETLDEKWSFTTSIVNNEITLYAKWVINQYTITFNSNGGSFINSIVEDFATTISEPSIPVKEGYTFSGWYRDSLLNNPYEFTTMPAEDLNLHAKWTINQYTITFNSNGGSEVSSITQDYASEIIKPMDPTREGYTFVGWFSNSSLTSAYSFTTMPAQNITFYAKWNILNYNISYYLNGGINGENPSSYQVTTETITLDEPIRVGHTFGGWYDNAEFIGDRVTEIEIGTFGDITLYAKWEIITFTITYNLDGGTNGENPSSYQVTTETITLDEPIRVGHTFGGWYDNAEFIGDRVTEIEIGTFGDITLYAKWEIITFTITYNLDGGTNGENPSSYQVTTETITLDEPIRVGHTFGGWYDNAEFIGDRVTEIEIGTFGDITLYAKWEINQYEITYLNVYVGQIGNITLSTGETFVSILLGESHSLALSSTGRIFTWGNNEYGQLGDATTTKKSTPIEITSQFSLGTYETIKSITVGYRHSSALTSKGRIFTWGYNEHGQLGDGTTINKLTPIEITSQFNLGVGEMIEIISLGGLHSSALTTSGRLFTWGYNGYGQLGDGTTTTKSTPTEITSQFSLSAREDILSISLGTYHSSVITSTGRLFTWGYNGYGQLGNGTTTAKLTPTEITSRFNLGVGERILSTSLGTYHSSVITSTGRMFTWGYNYNGQLGDGTTTNKLTPTEITSQFNLGVDEKIEIISLGDLHSSALTASGRLFMWGYNGYGQLGDGTTTSKSRPTEITNRYNLGIGETIKTTSLGVGSYSSALTSSGRIFTWGNNEYGILGDGTTTHKSTPREITVMSSLLIHNEIYNYASDTILYTPVLEGYTFNGWYTNIYLTNPYTFTTMPAEDITLYGKWDINTYNINYNLNGGTNGSNPTNYTIETETITLAEASKEGYTFIGWYDNSGFAGDSLNEITIGTFGDITLYAKWAINQYTITFESNEGSLVDSMTQDYSTSVFDPTEPTREGYIFVGWYSDSTLTTPYTFTIMPAQNMTLYAKWDVITYTIKYNLYGGNNYNNPPSYQITTDNITLEDPSKEGYTFGGWYDNDEFVGDIVTEIEIGTSGDIILYAKWTINQYDIYYYEFRDYNPLKDIPLYPGEIITEATLAYSHSSVITSTGRIFTWGNNDYGQLGDGTTISKSIPTEITSKFNLGLGEMIEFISLGWQHSIAVTTTGRIFTWGSNTYGQLGDGTTINRLSPTDITSDIILELGETIVIIKTGEYHSLVLSSTGRVFTWGSNTYGQLGDGTTTKKLTPTEITSQFSLDADDTIESITSGSYHSSALSSKGRVFAWGLNVSGQLGDGTTTNKSTPTEISNMFNLNPEETIEEIYFGHYHSSAITSIGRVFMWGGNSSGQLGVGTTTNKSTPIEITNRFNLIVGERIINVSLGYHSSALTSTGRIYTWGWNVSGQLGDGTTSDKLIPTEITNHFNLSIGETINIISLGYAHSSAVTSNGKFFVWGHNSDNRLGDGTTTNRSIPTEIGTSISSLAYQEVYSFSSSINEYIPTLEGYAFSGWYKDIYLTQPYTFTIMTANDLFLYGRWTNLD